MMCKVNTYLGYKGQGQKIFLAKNRQNGTSGTGAPNGLSGIGGISAGGGGNKPVRRRCSSSNEAPEPSFLRPASAQSCRRPGSGNGHIRHGNRKQHITHGTVTMLGDNDFGHAAQVVSLLVAEISCSIPDGG